MNAARPARARMRVAGAVLTVAATLLTSACAAGRAAQTADQIPTQDGVNATVRNMALRGLSITAPTKPYYPAGSDVVLNVVLVNTGTSDDALTGITTSIASNWGSYKTVRSAAQVTALSKAVKPGKGSQHVVIGAGERVSYGVPDATMQLLLTDTIGRLYAANDVTIDFSFAHAGDVKVVVPVQLNDHPGDESIPVPSGATDDS